MTFTLRGMSNWACAIEINPVIRVIYVECHEKTSWIDFWRIYPHIFTLGNSPSLPLPSLFLLSLSLHQPLIFLPSCSSPVIVDVVSSLSLMARPIIMICVIHVFKLIILIINLNFIKESRTFFIQFCRERIEWKSEPNGP